MEKERKQPFCCFCLAGLPLPRFTAYLAPVIGRMQVLFWISLAVLLYTYVGYGLLAGVLAAFVRRKAPPPMQEYPPLTIVVPAYNEGGCLAAKLQNTLSLHYPEHQRTILVVTDGSTDDSDEVVRRYPGVTLLSREQRQGKSAAINRAMEHVVTPFVVFTDANTLLHPDCLLKIVQHYASPEVGGVAGEKRIFDQDGSAVGLGERWYWQYESLLKKNDAKFYTVVGAAGELFSIRTSLFQPLPENVILDDFVISARVCLQGYRFVYEAGASATEHASASMEEEQKRKVRISAGCFQALLLLKSLLNPLRNGRLAFQYVSHRVLRWTLCPCCLLLLFISNSVLAFSPQRSFYWYSWWAQLLFYLLALTGSLLFRRKKLPRLLLAPYYFLFMNLSLCRGFYLFITKKQSVLWAKARRKPPP